MCTPAEREHLARLLRSYAHAGRGVSPRSPLPQATRDLWLSRADEVIETLHVTVEEEERARP